MKLYNVSEIKAEDYPEEVRSTVERLGNILNPFMQQVVELADGRISDENTTTVTKTFEVTVDVTGKPTLNNKLQTGKSSIIGFQVINDVNLTNAALTVDEQPYIASYTRLGNGLVQINKITGLLPNNKYRLTLRIF